MSSTVSWIVAFRAPFMLVLMLSFSGLSILAQHASAEEKVRAVQASEVPEAVMATVQARRPGIYITSISRQLWDNDQTYYVLHGSQVGKYWVLTVRADGVLKKMDEEGEPPVNRR